MNLSHPLTLDDVEFYLSTGAIEKYTAYYTNIVVPDNFDRIPVISIGDEAFCGNKLTSVSIPDSVTAIDDYAFRYNALTSVLPLDSVTTINGNVFDRNVTIFRQPKADTETHNQPLKIRKNIPLKKLMIFFSYLRLFGLENPTNER